MTPRGAGSTLRPQRPMDVEEDRLVIIRAETVRAGEAARELQDRSLDLLGNDTLAMLEEEQRVGRYG